MLSIDNGELLRKAQDHFDAFVTVDTGIPYQQNLAGLRLIVVLLRVGSNRADAIAPYVAEIEAAIDSAEAGSLVLIKGREQP